MEGLTMKPMWIGGEWTAGTAAGEIPVQDPATEEVLETVPRGTARDVEAAVAAARRAFEPWRRVPAAIRAEMLHEIARKIRAHQEELIRLLTLEEGKPWPENEEEILWSANTFDYYAELARHERGRVIPSPEPGQLSLVLKEPYGVVGCIVPWNYPILLMAWKVAPALAAGNTVVIKPSELTPLTTLRLAEVAMDHLPPGVVNIVTGYGPEVGEPLVTHPEVPVIAFTGSLATGQRIAALAAPMMKKLHLELGGKDPFVVGPDAPLELAVKALAYAALINAGQVCTSTERVYVPASIYHRFAEEIASFVSTLRLGHGLDPQTDIGPMAGPSYRAKVEDHVADALARGAHALTGARRPPHLPRGFFYEPTVLVDVDHTMKVMREETFGPVIPLMPYRTFDEAIALCNDNPYGLGACLMSHDPRLIRRFYEEVKAGTVWINDPLTDNYAGPFGGMKLSGIGRELGLEGLEEFRETKHVHWDIEGGEKPWWFPYGRSGKGSI
jgi:betaine-aldehyde dehydrogenase